ncbi:MAG TPA: hypothetical protein VMK31_05870 [Sphingomicrobium sp.]|nr:hypothetical protein [Sphingomicrobium sp.]
MKPPAKRLLLVGMAAMLAIPAVAQGALALLPGPAAPAAQPQPEAETETEVVEVVEEETVETKAPPPPVEYPTHARRDPSLAGAVAPSTVGLGAEPWGQASGAFLSTLLRRMDTPLASRWAHIGLRNALFARSPPPDEVNPVDWTAERAWLLLRMGEADAARMLVASVDTDLFTPKMVQVAVQTALANSDPLALCPLTAGMRRVEPTILPLVLAICSGLNAEPQSASAQIETARRRGPVGGIDLALAQKAVGATSDTGTAAVIEWEPVEALTAWRYGLSTATGMSPPERLIERASPQLRAWYARSPMIPFADRLESARIATGLGVFSSQALNDYYSWIYDQTDPNELSASDAWQLRLAFAASSRDARLAAIRHLLAVGEGRLQREASRALVAAAAARIDPDPELEADAPELIASMLAAGMDQQAARWAGAIEKMSDEHADPAWALLALGAPEGIVATNAGRVNAFINRDTSPGLKRSALLVAGLAALGRLDIETASRLNARHRLHIGRTSSWSRMIDAAARRGQSGTVRVLTGTGMQAPDFKSLPSAHLFRSVMALRNTDQDFLARMIAAEALART